MSPVVPLFSKSGMNILRSRRSLTVVTVIKKGGTRRTNTVERKANIEFNVLLSDSTSIY